jgi:ribosomal protein S18 acetylase RimI-like enzyme
VFERFTEDARRVVVLAQEESRLLGHNYVGTEHILLGLLHRGGSARRETRAAMALTSLHISLDAARQQVREIVGEGESTPDAHIPFTPRAKQVLEASVRETVERGQVRVGSEHLLLGLIRVGDGIAITVLQELGADADQVRNAVDRAMSGRDLATVRLRPMREDEWDAWRARTVTEYADEMVRNKGVAHAEALARAEEETDSLLTDGLATADHHLFAAEDPGSGARLGYLWFGPRRHDPDAGVAWLYDIFVEEAGRGQGVGRAMMKLLETEARSMGIRRIELNVFGDNAAARRLYEASGFIEMTRQLGKDVDSSGSD